jgi:hypothetical protein
MGTGYGADIYGTARYAVDVPNGAVEGDEIRIDDISILAP